MTKIYFQRLEVDSISRNSAIHHGKNVIAGRQSSVKINQGFGDVLGEDTEVVDGLFGVLDHDDVDASISQKASARRQRDRLMTESSQETSDLPTADGEVS